MNVKRFKGYTAVVLAGLVLIAAATEVLMNLGNHADLSVPWKIIHDFRIALLMLLSAAGGIVVYFAVRLLIRGVVDIRAARRPAEPSE